MSGRPAPRRDDAPAAAREDLPSGDVSALYRAEGPRLLRFFRRRVGSGEEAADLVQESFSRLLRLDGLSALVRPEAYLRRIGQNLLRDRAKFAVRRSEALHMSADDADLAGTDQNRLLETRDLLDRIERAVLELPRETREVFMSSRVDGLSYGEIAERTGLSIKQVEKRLAQSVRELDRLFGPL
ncbi:MAG TPA: sigma-70 family RNA polymerase sigma factor [Sphingomonas sp.]|nr:sigma-70 family RNA polymerase sigma factor [Sphingomonas sp.]